MKSTLLGKVWCRFVTKIYADCNERRISDGKGQIAPHLRDGDTK